MLDCNVRLMYALIKIFYIISQKFSTTTRKFCKGLCLFFNFNFNRLKLIRENMRHEKYYEIRRKKTILRGKITDFLIGLLKTTETQGNFWKKSWAILTKILKILLKTRQNSCFILKYTWIFNLMYSFYT